MSSVYVTIALCVISISLVLWFVFGNGSSEKKQESFVAPCSQVNYGSHGFYDFGVGTPLVHANWRRGTYFQPWVPDDTGLYTSNRWGPSTLRHEEDLSC